VTIDWKWAVPLMRNISKVFADQLSIREVTFLKLCVALGKDEV
jgi:hypothetical protein